MILDLIEREANTEGSWENDIRGVQILEEKLSLYASAAEFFFLKENLITILLTR
jgi:hypothetical protein